MDDGRRLMMTLVISLLLHGVLILGVGFAVSEDAPLVPTLDVIFSQTSTPLTPKQADFLAQANQQGGGDHATAQRPGTASRAWCRRTAPGWRHRRNAPPA